MPRLLVPLLLLIALLCAEAAHATTTSYTPSAAEVANPERGFYRHKDGNCDDHDFVASKLAADRMLQKRTLVMCMFYLKDFKTAPISQAQLEHFQRQANAVRAGGVKMILRFAYTESKTDGDAELSQVLAHLDQLSPYLRANSDVIAVMESGFVGAWGEGYYTQYFGNKGAVTTDDWANRKAIVEKLLSILPANRMVALRTPLMKTQMFATGGGRVGHHNDCFLASGTDFGTFQNPAVEYPFLAADTANVAMGGETCLKNSPRSDCPTARAELELFHYTYLNGDGEAEVLNSWGDCIAEMRRRLGYRLTLKSMSAPATVTRASGFDVQLTIRNDGYAGTVNDRSILLVLRNARGTYKLPLTSTRNLSASVTLNTTRHGLQVPASVPAGDYELLLSLPDPALSLTNRPEYAIQLANSGLWEPATGYNRLLRTLHVQ